MRVGFANPQQINRDRPSNACVGENYLRRTGRCFKVLSSRTISLLAALMIAAGSLIYSTDAEAFFPDLECPTFSDVNFTGLFGSLCVSNSLGGIVIDSTHDIALSPNTGKILSVGIFTNGSTGVTVNLGSDATNIVLTGGTTSDAMPAHQFTVDATTADALNAWQGWKDRQAG